MKKVFVSALAISGLLTIAMYGQSVGAGANASANSNTSVSADKSGASVQSNTNANASGQANATLPEHKHEGSKPANHESKHESKPAKHQQSNSSAATNSANLSADSTIQAVLSKSVDSKNCKPGDQVIARATQDVKSDGKVIIPKGSRLVGHVTEAKTRAKGESNSALGVAFDRAVLKNGQQVEMNTVVQAIAAAQTTAPAPDMDATMNATGSAAGAARTSGGGLLNAVGSTTGSATGTLSQVSAGATSTVGSATHVGGASLGSALSSSSSGVIGLNNLSLASQAANSTSGSVITSTGKSVHLDSGTQLLLKVVSQ